MNIFFSFGSGSAFFFQAGSGSVEKNIGSSSLAISFSVRQQGQHGICMSKDRDRLPIKQRTIIPLGKLLTDGEENESPVT